MRLASLKSKVILRSNPTNGDLAKIHAALDEAYALGQEFGLERAADAVRSLKVARVGTVKTESKSFL